MKLLLVCFLASLIVALAQNPGYTQMKIQCQNEVGATDADAALVRPFQVPTTRGASCIWACLQKKWGMMNADNTFNSAVAIEKMSHMKDRNATEYNKMVTVIKTCKALETDQSDQCDASKALATCMQTQRDAQELSDNPSHHY